MPVATITHLHSSDFFKVIGVMSGTSLDGLDIALCSFRYDGSKWSFKINDAKNFRYDDRISQMLENAYHSSGRELTITDYEYGRFIGKKINELLKISDFKPDFISSHGHTIFHDPDSGYTLQIGKGSAIAAETGLPCICDFRSSDVSKSGQGAPLVPIGDRLLFADFDICLNLGGFCNLSFEKNGERIAFDISPCNMALNHFAQKLGKAFDMNGELGSRGKLNQNLLDELNSIPYYNLGYPKSLGKEWFINSFLPIVEKYQIDDLDILSTLYEHIAIQIANSTNIVSGRNILITGGGAKNEFLIHLIKSKSKKTIIIPDELIIDYKEALIFAFLGVLYLIGKPGALKSVTGATEDSISGCLYY